jgi:hypothetical protein
LAEEGTLERPQRAELGGRRERALDLSEGQGALDLE